MNDRTPQQAEPAGSPSQPPQPQPVLEAQRPAHPEPDQPPVSHALRIYSHSTLLYWWPVWVVGYVMAIITYAEGHGYQLGQSQTWIHPSSSLGSVFFLVLFLVILITNFSVRGWASAMVIVGSLFVTVLLAYLRWWDEVFGWFGSLAIHLNLGAYFWFSTLMLVLWVVTVFGLDHMRYWEVTPGQLTHRTRIGGGSKSYNAQGMALEIRRDDLFRHWVLGMGSGDLEIRTSGGASEQINVRSVLFIGLKVRAMQKLIAEVPEGSEPS